MISELSDMSTIRSSIISIFTASSLFRIAFNSHLRHPHPYIGQFLINEPQFHPSGLIKCLHLSQLPPHSLQTLFHLLEAFIP